jgi:hypothetical protein
MGWISGLRDVVAEIENWVRCRCYDVVSRDLEVVWEGRCVVHEWDSKPIRYWTSLEGLLLLNVVHGCCRRLRHHRLRLLLKYLLCLKEARELRGGPGYWVDEEMVVYVPLRCLQELLLR